MIDTHSPLLQSKFTCLLEDSRYVCLILRIQLLGLHHGSTLSSICKLNIRRFRTRTLGSHISLLELDCMPAGMELFPAASETQCKWIQQIIDESDYYIVILAVRYGTVHPDKNISYTEMEYRYALSIGKPVLAFLHENIADLHNSKHERKQQIKKTG